MKNNISIKNMEISYKDILKIAGPIIVSQSAVILTSVIDLAFIRTFGVNAIAAVAIANIVCATLLNFLEGVRSGTTVLVSMYQGKKEYDLISGTLLLSLATAIIVGVIAFFLAPMASHYVYQLVGHDVINKFGIAYMTYWLQAIPFILIFFTFTGFFRGLHDTVTPLIITLFISSLNVMFDYMFIFGNFYAPKMGVAGASFASLLAFAIGSILIIMVFLVRKKTRSFFSLNVSIRKIVPRFLKLVTQIGGANGITVLSLVIFAALISRISPAALAAHQIAFQMFLVAYLPAMGFLVAASVLVAHLVGIEKSAQIDRLVNKIIRLSFSFMLIFSLLVILFSEQLAHFFLPNDPALVALSKKVLEMVAVAQLGTSIYMVLRGALTGIKDTKFIFFAELFAGYVIFIPLSYIFAMVLKLGLIGAYLGFFCWVLVDCLIFLARFYLSKKSFVDLIRGDYAIRSES